MPENNNILTYSLDQNLNIFKQILINDATVTFKYFKQRNAMNYKYCIIFIGMLSSKETVNEKIIMPIMNNLVEQNINNEKIIDYILNKVIMSAEVKQCADIDAIVKSLLSGDTIFLIDGINQALLINTKELNTRAITEPDSERIIRGPREGFTESIETNLSLIRRKILSPSLKFKYLEVGFVTKTKICICYIEGIANPKILEELEKRLKDIEIDGILDSGSIQELIKDSPLSALKTIGNTERPDIVAGKLLEGRIALICDGSPSALTVPFIFVEYLQINEDNYTSAIFTSINKFLRIFGLFITTSLPAIYVALTTFHQEMIPTPLLLSFSAAREDVPFPTIVEMLLMMFVFELLREAGVRMPLAIGSAVSTVGALVLGQAAVEARIISSPIVIVTAVTGITSYLTPKLEPSLILTRLILLLAASCLGFYGYILILTACLIYLLSIRSFGIPYGSAHIDENDIKDTSKKMSWWLMQYRSNLRQIGIKSPKRR